MTPIPPHDHTPGSPPAASGRVAKRFDGFMAQIYHSTDRVFGILMGVQWIAILAIAATVSPPWSSAGSHMRVVVAGLIGALIAVPPMLLALCKPGRIATRHCIAICQALFGVLIISTLGGRVEGHFHTFASLALLSLYKDWRVLASATAVIALDHLVRGSLWPRTIYGTYGVDPFRWIEYCIWLLCADAVLIYAIAQSRRSLWENSRDRVSLELNNSKLHTLSLVAEKTDNAVVLTDAQGRVEWVNAGFVRMTGYTLDEVIGRKPGEFLQGPETDPDAVRTLGQKIAAHEQVALEIVNYHKNGTPYWITLDVQPIQFADGRLGFFAIESDITHRKAYEKQLLEAKIAAEKANRSKNDFLANMSHEIRTPLNGMIGTTELLMETQLTTQQADLLRISKASAEALLAIVNDVLDLSKIEAGRLEIEDVPFDAIELFETGVGMFAPKANEKSLELVCGVDPRLEGEMIGDPTRIRQILLNLLANAVKFTETGTVSVQARVIEERRESYLVQISVSDTGIGIPADRLDAIFESFMQTDTSTTRQFGGTGLGLTIVRELTRLMDGEVRVESTPGQGSRFDVIIPLVIGEKRNVETLSEEVRGMRVLVVDDNDSNCMIFKEYLRTWEMEPATVTDPRDAMALAREARSMGQPYDLIILDGHMPFMSGMELARTLRDSGYEQTPMILASSYDESMLEPAERQLFTRIISKPVPRKKLRRAIERSLATSFDDTRVDASQETSDLPLQGRRILVAEDNATNQLVVRRFLEGMGASVEIAVNGVQAVSKWTQHSFDAILMDCQMPDMDGYEATREIRTRARGRTHRIPIIALTANALTGDREKCLDVGMDDYLSKPVRREELGRILAKWTNTEEKAAASEPEQPPRPDGHADENTGHQREEATMTVDLNDLLERTSNDRQLAGEMLELFESELRSLQTTLSDPEQNSATDDLRKLAHSTKGAALNCGAHSLAEQSAALETAIKTGGEPDAIAADISSMREMVDACLAELPRVIDSLKSGAPDQPETSR